MKRRSFCIDSGDLPETMGRLCISTKVPHQEIRWNYSILRAVVNNVCGQIFVHISVKLLLMSGDWEWIFLKLKQTEILGILWFLFSKMFVYLIWLHSTHKHTYTHTHTHTRTHTHTHTNPVDTSYLIAFNLVLVNDKFIMNLYKHYALGITR